MTPDTATTDTVINGWTIRRASLPGDDQVQIDVLRKHVIIDHHDPEWVILWVKAYIDLGHHLSKEQTITSAHRERATALAAFRDDLLSGAWDLPLDGEPTIRT